MNELLVRTSSYSTPIVIVGDLNVHVDDATDNSSTKLADVLAAHSLVQHVDVPTHSLGHTLDLIITRFDSAVTLLPVDPPSLSDHSFVVVDIDCQPLGNLPTDLRVVRNWRSIDIEALSRDLSNSTLLQSTPESADAAFLCYDSTLRSLLDQHAPLTTRRVSRQSTARWFDEECRKMKRTTRAS